MCAPHEKRMCGTKSFVELIQAYQNWAGEAFERFSSSTSI